MSDHSALGASAARETPRPPRPPAAAPPALDARACAGRLLSGLVHELKNPLTVVDGYAQLLHARLSQDDDAREDLAVLLREARRLGVLLDDVLAWVGRTDEARGALEARELLRAALALSAFELRRHHVSVELVGDDFPDVCVEGRYGECLHALVTLLLALCACEARAVQLSVSIDDPESVRFGWTWQGSPSDPDRASAEAWEVARGAATVAGGRLIAGRVDLTVALELPRAP